MSSMTCSMTCQSACSGGLEFGVNHFTNSSMTKIMRRVKLLLGFGISCCSSQWRSVLGASANGQLRTYIDHSFQVPTIYPALTCLYHQIEINPRQIHLRRRDLAIKLHGLYDRRQRNGASLRHYVSCLYSFRLSRLTDITDNSRL
jgi:hypothetical protein